MELSRIWMLSSVRPRPLSLSTRPRVSKNVTSVPLAHSSENLAYCRQKTYKIEWHHKVTSYANSTSLFTAYHTNFVKRKLFEPTEDVIKTVMKPFRVALISLLFDVIFITRQLRYHQLTTWQSALLVLFTVSLGCYSPAPSLGSPNLAGWNWKPITRVNQ